jgi:hypothetical protein
MSATPRDRFLAALAKMLGENPLETGPLQKTLVCEAWLLKEILDSIFPASEGNFALNREKLNRLLLNCERQMVTEHFYDYFFGSAGSLEKFEAAVEKFRIKAMWLYGNFYFALKELGTGTQAEFRREISKTEPRSPTDFSREPFEDIEDIPTEDLGLLGYISGKQRIADLDICLETLQVLAAEPTRMAEILKSIGPDKQKRVSEILAKNSVSFPTTGTEGLTPETLAVIVSTVKQMTGSLRTRQAKAVDIALRNTHRYLTLPYLDVYVATSMRTQQDYENQHSFVQEVFSNSALKDLPLRYFDPTASYADDRITKGLVEMLMLRRATVTIYTASAEDTLGKDSELAATLAQGKAVIAYVPKGLDSKADLLRVDHPLGLQIAVNTGVAHGILIVRSPEACARMLRKVLLRELTFEIRHEKGNFLLEETETKSVLRVVSDDPYLTHAFWTFFHQREN